MNNILGGLPSLGRCDWTPETLEPCERYSGAAAKVNFVPGHTPLCPSNEMMHQVARTLYGMATVEILSLGS